MGVMGNRHVGGRPSRKKIDPPEVDTHPHPPTPTPTPTHCACVCARARVPDTLCAHCARVCVRALCRQTGGTVVSRRRRRRVRRRSPGPGPPIRRGGSASAHWAAAAAWRTAVGGTGGTPNYWSASCSRGVSASGRAVTAAATQATRASPRTDAVQLCCASRGRRASRADRCPRPSCP